LSILNLELLSSHVLILERRKLIINLHLRVVQEIDHWLRRKECSEYMELKDRSGKMMENV
jgi:hypothetical protein